MKAVIRKALFETNSSSVHGIVICTEDEAKRIVEDNIWFKEDGPDGMEIKTFDELMSDLQYLADYKDWLGGYEDTPELFRDFRYEQDDWKCLSEMGENGAQWEWKVRVKGEYKGLGVLSYTYWS